MKQEVAEKWVAALRSGEYQQTQKRLCRANDAQGTLGFCCLGVLCDVFVKENPTASQWKRWANKNEVGFLLDNGRFVNETFAAPPTEVRDWAELNGNVGDCGHSEKLQIAFAARFKLGCDNYPSLANANDSGASFEQIADFIEQNWEEL